MTSPREVTYRLRAEEDIEEIVGWLANEAGPKVAGDFVDALEDVQERIATFPQIGSTRFAYLTKPLDVRVHALTGFPYLVFYFVEQDAVNVLRVLHRAREVGGVTLEL